MCDKPILDKITAEVAAYAGTVFAGHLDSVILYGSYARGDYDEDSDIDVMVVVDLPAAGLAGHRRAFAEFSSRIDLRYNVLLSVKLQDRATWEQWRDSLPFFRNVVKEGVRIVA